MPLQLRRGNTAEVNSITPLVGELIYDTQLKTVNVGDGSTAGGIAIAGVTINAAKDAAAQSILAGTHKNISFSYNSTTKTLSATVDILTHETIEADAIITGKIFNTSSSVVVDVDTATFNGNLTGNVTGNVTGNISGIVTGLAGSNITGNLTGNTVGFHTGDVKGSIFADDSTLMVDAVDGIFVGDLIGNTTGTHTGNVVTSLLSSSDSSAIRFDTPVLFESDITVENELVVRDALTVIHRTSTDRLVTFTTSTNDELSPSILIRKSRGTFNSPAVVQVGDDLGGFSFMGHNGTSFSTAAQWYNEVNQVVGNNIGVTSYLRMMYPTSGLILDKLSISQLGAIIYATSATEDTLQLVNNHNTVGNAANLVLARSRGTYSTPTSVVNGDILHDISIRGHDGTTYRLAGQIRASVDGAVASTIVPGRLDFTLNDATGTSRNILRLTNDKVVHADKIGSLDTSYIQFMQIPYLPSFAGEGAADTAIGGAGARINGMMFYDSTANAVKAVVSGAWTAL